MATINPRLLTVVPTRILPSIRLKRRSGHPLASWIRLAVVLGLLAISIVVFFAIEQPSEAGENSYELGADSHTYFAIAQLMQTSGRGNIQVLAFSGSMLGPPLQAMLLRTPVAIMLCNVGLFFISVAMCSAVEGLSLSTLALLLAVNATTLVSVITLNKEIFAMVATLLLCRYVYTGKHSKLLLLATLAVGLLARWQQTGITLLFLYLDRKRSYWRKHPGIALAGIVAGITVAYPVVLHAVPSALAWATDQAQGGGGIVLLNTLQAHFGFPLVLLPKALMSLFNHLVTPTYFFSTYWQQDFNDLANQYVINLHTLAMLGVLSAAFATGRLHLRRPLPLFSAIYLVIVASSPFVQSRYEYPIYVAMSFDLSRREALTNPFLLKAYLPNFMRKRQSSRETAATVVTQPPPSGRSGRVL